VTLRAQTLIALLEDTFRSLIRHGVSHLLVVDNHRSNNPFVEAAARTVRAETGALVGSFFPWGTIINHAPSHYEDFAAVFGHGGEPESSTALGKAAAHLWINNSEISTTGTRGDPTVANAERGRKLVEAAVEDLVRVIEAFKKIPAEVKR
jgi:creatinine amidohydrolase/Fe(II)-dependent formamide hydrolase-like protein